MAQTRSLAKMAVVLVGLVVMFALGWGVAKTGVGQAVDPASLTDLERQFTERMQNVALVGHFTIEGREDRGGSPPIAKLIPTDSHFWRALSNSGDPAPERYEIASVTKVDDDRWRFNARMAYGNVDVTLPVVVPIVWAGDTPMVSITDYTIPTLGTVTARVFFYGERYAGSWQHGEFSGLMYGRIEKMGK